MVELPLDPNEILRNGRIQGLELAWNIFMDLPLWVKLVATFVITSKILRIVHPRVKSTQRY